MAAARLSLPPFVTPIPSSGNSGAEIVARFHCALLAVNSTQGCAAEFHVSITGFRARRWVIRAHRSFHESFLDLAWNYRQY